MGRQNTKHLLQNKSSIFYLKEDEIANPYLVVRDFFSHAHLPEIRQMLWSFFKISVTGTFPEGEAVLRKERVEMVMLYELLLRLVEAVHLLNEREKLQHQ